ncbi:efflux RND transporter permease subunit [Pseudidiomarina andamanensis]|uniref:Efflux RND transporter permease subunit n=1 Tax=Pseudidiomarina andamanensis TaxID=1940690 RepID=A0AA92IM48_9GAMM|nr:efflux RND transporter permease subunit [Pseudidiomarina andamanensis]MDS0218564.1 efflux RND transporter permease subunit [Pseudidiomarina andamanensis]QGT95432.1 efflux RND transporter permease subunit [Pseudidiomarina andamanensis]
MSIVKLAVKRPVTIAMLTLAVMLFGFVSLGRIPVTLLPDLAYPTLTVRTDYPGGAPSEVEQLVSKPIEETLGTVKGIRRIESISRAGQSDVLLEFSWGTDMEMASLDVREKLDWVELPLDLEKPVLLRFNPSEEPVYRLALSLNENDQSISALKQLRTYAEEDLKRHLESIEGVASVRLGGGLEDEIQVLVNERQAAALQIPMTLITQRLREENINLSGGRIEADRAEYLVRTLNQFKNLEDIRSIYLTTRNNRPILLKDIAVVENAYKERDAISRVGGMEAVEVSLYKEGDANTVQVSKAIQSHLQQLKTANLLPEQYAIKPIYDQAVFISAAIAEVRDAAIIGGLLAMVIIYLFLQRVWPTIVISLAIPISIIATFNLLYGYQVSLNMMSLGGIALAVGMLVDNAIVVLENIARHQQHSDAEQAAEVGTREVSGAIIASTLTTMAVFFPLVFVEGIAGQLFRDQALTVTFSLAASLLVALTLIPMLSSRSRNKSNAEIEPFAYAKGWRFWLKTPIYLVFRWIPFALISVFVAIARVLTKLFTLITTPLLKLFNTVYQTLEAGYQRLLNVALKRAGVTLGIILLSAAACYTLLPRLPVALLPNMAQGEFYVEVELQPGATIYETDMVLAELGNVIATSDELNAAVDRYYTIAGTGSLLNAAPGQSGNQWGRLNVVMADHNMAATEKVQQQLRQKVQSMPGVMAKFGTPELFSFASPITIEFVGYDLALLQQAAQQFSTTLEEHPQFTDIRVNMTDGQPELAVYFDHAKLSQYGLTSAEVSELLATKIGGRVASQFSLDDRKIDILVRSQSADRNSLRDLQQVIINPGAAREITLQAVAEVVPVVGPSEITRIDQQRTAIVEANLNYGDLGSAVSNAQQLLDETQLPLTITARVAGQNEDMQRSFTSLQFALVLAVFLVYLVMASQFESLLHPLFILFTVPLAGAGSVLGLYLMGTELSIIVFIGLIMLAGIVVNNAIVLVDRINQLREEGIERYQAVYTAAQQRLRPILMTMLTTVLGLLPLAIGLGEGAEIRAPMAISVIAGLLFSTLLTLLFIPCLYLLVDRKSAATGVKV